METRSFLQTAGGVLVLGWLAFTAWGPRQTAAPRTGAPKLSKGATIDVAITLVTTDVKALACASADKVGDRHCGFEAPGTVWSQADAAIDANLLAPYKTTDDQLLLVPGLFAQPALRERLEVDPPLFNREHQRFVAHCKLTVEGQLRAVKVRWAPPPGGQWLDEQNAWTGSVTGCKLSDG